MRQVEERLMQGTALRAVTGLTCTARTARTADMSWKLGTAGDDVVAGSQSGSVKPPLLQLDITVLVQRAGKCLNSTDILGR